MSNTNDGKKVLNVAILTISDTHSKKGFDILGIDNNEKYAPLLSFFDTKGNYKIASQLEASYRAGVPNQFQKVFFEVDIKVHVVRQ